MNLKKIGKFIANQRKSVGLTQFELAEKLNISDRAVSKWETGKGMPDSLIMLRLCDILNINVNELLSGEKLDMKTYNKKAEENLIAMKKKSEEHAKQLLNLEWFVGTTCSLLFFILIFTASFIDMPTIARIVMIGVGILLFVFGIIYCLRIEWKVGYYVCAECGHKYVPTFGQIMFSTHMGRTRNMKCPKCGKKSWQKKTVNED